MVWAIMRYQFGLLVVKFTNYTSFNFGAVQNAHFFHIDPPCTLRIEQNKVGEDSRHV